MELYPNTYFHLYNRTNNHELLFKEEENYRYFLAQYRKRFNDSLETLAYCLMPTHFHFLVQVIDEDVEAIVNQIGIWLGSYTKAVNRKYNRHGSLFQKHTKAIPVEDDSYLLTLVIYIHQNPIRSGLVQKLENWEYSSYRDYVGIREGALPSKNLITEMFEDRESFRQYSEELIVDIDERYWV